MLDAVAKQADIALADLRELVPGRSVSVGTTAAQGDSRSRRQG